MRVELFDFDSVSSTELDDLVNLFVPNAEGVPRSGNHCLWAKTTAVAVVDSESFNLVSELRMGEKNFELLH